MSRVANESLLALYISPDAVTGGRLRDSLAADETYPVRLQAMAKMTMAQARIEGGGVDLVLLDLRGPAAPDGDLEPLLHLKRRAAPTPVLVICSDGHEGLALKAMHAGASSYLFEKQLNSQLGPLLHSILGAAQQAPVSQAPEGLHDAEVLSFLGAKGGAGTTTIAFNVATALARRAKVALVELRPTLGTLSAHLGSSGITRNLSHLIQARSMPSNFGGVVAATLWPCKKIPGLHIVFGPQKPEDCLDVDPSFTLALIQALSRLADYVILDLPSNLSDANRAAIENSVALTVIVERDPISVHAAQVIISHISKWPTAPQPIGAAIVNRSFVGSPMPLEGIGQTLGCAVTQVIPPAGDLCLLAQNSATSLIDLDPDSLISASLRQLAEVIAPQRAG